MSRRPSGPLGRGRYVGRLLAFLVRRLTLAIAVVVTVAVVAYGMVRVLRPDIYGGEDLLPGLASDLERAFGRLDFGESCGLPGCPVIRELWLDGLAADLCLLVGGLCFGVVAGVAGGVLCATRPRSPASRALEGAATLAYCTPVYVLGLGLLLFFAPFGWWPLPFFFDPHSYAPLQDDPWDWFRSQLVPWVIIGAPFAAACLRLTVAICVDVQHDDFVRTARAKGLSEPQVMRRHAAPMAYASVASLVAASVPLVVTNVVLVEFVFSVPGFFRYTKGAIAAPDIPMLQAQALWGAVMIVVVGMLADLALVLRDPRIRASGLP
jgi:peptide/nickel transport system permease protein